ncbi:MAG: DUF2784 domain-containing protein [Desulfobacteraceae bacterium]|nr:DUF2784 domain-containing protein [Desulfobacteraceae bacterium]
MIHLILANCVLGLHLVFILFAVLGGLLVFYRSWIKWIHLPMAAWAAAIEFTGLICPLTPLENHFKILAGQSGYEDGFIHHYLLKIIYPDGLTREIQVVLGLGVLIFNILIYTIYFKSRKNQTSPIK